MRVETFLDYNKIIKVVFDIEDANINYDFICDTTEGNLAINIVENLQRVSVLEQDSESDICKLKISDTIFINISKTTGEIECINTLTAFETRALAQGKEIEGLFERTDKIDFTPKTDLHTHFAGALSPDILLEVAENHELPYPESMLRECGIDVEKYNIDENGLIQIRDLDKDDIEKFKSKLMISQVTQETFNKMEYVYRLREPFTKNKELFADYLRALADDYKEKGIEYAELSFSAFKKDSDYMKIIHDVVPGILEETGVKLKFLVGLRRNAGRESNLDAVDKIRQLAKSPYIVGCDFMGHETNSTNDFSEELQELARYAMVSDPNFVIRVHAGENPMFKENVGRALEIIYEEYKKMPAGTPMPKVRIGHGLYGVDEKVLNLAKEMGAIIEFNMSSNLALNNINAISEVPIAEYIRNGVKVVLATDGHGMYSTSGEQEVILASAAGVRREEFIKIKEVENEVIQTAIDREDEHPPLENIEELYDVTYTTPDGSARYTKEIGERYRAEKEKAIEHLREKIAFTEAVTDPKMIAEVTNGKIPIMITGASKGNWPNISIEDQENIRVVMQVLANTLNPETSYLVTGGTNHGVEKEMHEAVNRRNKSTEEQLVLLGTLTLEATNDATNSLEKDTITHAIILESNGRLVNNWMELPDTQLEYVQERNGYMIAVGGGGVVNDMIQRAHNIGADMHLMDGPYGASTNKSRSLSGNNYSFKTGEELLKRLYERNPSMFHESFSLENLSEYVEQARSQIEVKEHGILEGKENELRTLEAEERSILEAERLLKIISKDREQEEQSIGE